MLALVLAGAAFAIVGQVAQFAKLQSAVAHAATLWLLACVGGRLISYAGYMLAYRDAARASGGPRFRLWTTARIVIFGMGASVLGTSVGSLAVDFWALRRTGTKRHTAARRVLALDTIEWTMLSCYACAAAALVLVTGAPAPLVMTLAWLMAVPAGVVCALWFTAPRRGERFTELPRRSRRVAERWPARIIEAARNRARTAFADAIAGVVFARHLLSHAARYRGGVFGYALYWAGDMFTLYAGLRAFGARPNVISLVLAYATGSVISALPLPAGGAGGIEAGMSLALHAVGIPLAPALLGVFAYRIVTFWLPVLPALALLPSIRRLHQKLPSVPHTRPDVDERAAFRPRAEPRG